MASCASSFLSDPALACRLAGCSARHVFAHAGIGGVGGDVPGLADGAWPWAFEINPLGALRHACIERGEPPFSGFAGAAR